MAAASGKGPKATVVKQSAIDHTSSFLQGLPDKPKEDLSLKEAIEKLSESIKASLAKGYTYQELAAMLSDKGIKISAFTLKNYVPSGKRRSAKDQATKPEGRVSRKPKAEKTANLEVLTPPITTVEKSSDESIESIAANEPDEPAVKAVRGGRRKSTTAAKTKSDNGATVKQTTARKPGTATKATPTAKPTTAAKKPRTKTAAKPATSRGRKKS